MSVSITDKNLFSAKQKLSDYLTLAKFRLNLFVVASSLIGYLVTGVGFDIISFLLLAVGGFLVTAGANTFNQVIEKDTDKLMPRTSTRPLPADRMKVGEAVLFGGVCSVFGLLILSLFNPLTAFLGALSLVSYSFIYTPMKRFGSVSVYVGAFPGAFPPLIGVVAALGEIESLGIFLFLIQFLWQFPHFWAIAWKAYDQYAGAGFFLLPQSGQKNKKSALIILLASVLTVSLGALGLVGDHISLASGIILSILGCGFVYFSYELYRQLSDKAALRLMFYSLFYLPLALAALFI